jgi:hypothetical protein
MASGGGGTAAAAGSAPQVVKKKKKKKQVWKMQPIDMRAYVPLPADKDSVENR